MLNLAEERLLLTYTGQRPMLFGVLTSGGLASHGVRGALLSELVVQGKLVVEDEAVVVGDATPTGDVLLDELLEDVRSVPSPPRVRQVLPLLWGLQSKRARHPWPRVFEGLAEKGIVRKEVRRGRIMWPETYVLEAPEEARRIREELREAVLGADTPSPRMVALLGILRHSRLLPKLLSKQELEQALPRIRELTEGDPVREALLRSRVWYDVLSAASYVWVPTMCWLSTDSGGSVFASSTWAIAAAVYLIAGLLYSRAVRRE
ncbi:MAG: hypothetical protein FJX75_07940 [Armatimonadetes bacterium]|nr:hypothetical protein [Armatimonadota bacterium]